MPRNPIWCAPLPALPLKTPSRGNPLPVPWFAQLDSTTYVGRRMFFSSSCAILFAFLNPGVLTCTSSSKATVANRSRAVSSPARKRAALRALLSLRPAIEPEQSITKARFSGGREAEAT
jgi:hypothetical protein